MDQAGSLGVGGRERLAQPEQRKGALAAEQRRAEQARPRLRYEAEIDEGRVKARARRRQRQVAMEIDGRADADRDAVDAGDDRFLRRRQRHQEVVDLGAVLAAGRHRHEVGEVVAGRERPRHAEDQVDAHGLVGVAFRQRLRHRRIHRPGDGVLLVRPVHADRLHRAVAGDLDMLAHRFPLTAPAPQRPCRGCPRPR